MLRHFNDSNAREHWFRDLLDEKLVHTLNRPTVWPKQDKLVALLAFCLLDNHFHLLLREIRENGISTFMQKLGTGMAKHFNEKYQERGSIFQGAYKSRTITGDSYLRGVSVYIQVKNAFELVPKEVVQNGVSLKNFDKVYDWVCKYPYSSLGNYSGEIESPIMDKDILGEIFTPKSFRNFAKDFMLARWEKEKANYRHLE